MANDEDRLHLLLVRSDDHGAALEGGLDAQDAGRVGTDDVPSEEDEDAGYLWNEGGDQGSLRDQRWGVVAPDTDAGRRMVAAVEDLIEERSRQSGRRLEPYYVKPGMSESEAQVWRKTVFESSVEDPEELPRYQLILGDLDGVSLEQQVVLGSDAYVGRLALDPLEGRTDPYEAYAAYAAKVLRWEREPSAAQLGRALFHTVHDDTPSTAVGFRSLVRPGAAQLQKWKDHPNGPQLEAEEVLSVGDEMVPNPQELLDLADQDRPGVMFTLSHGEGAPRSGWKSPVQQRERQGAMSFGSEGHLPASELMDKPVLPGGLWFMLACFGGGTPQNSTYYPWLNDLKVRGRYRGQLEPLLEGLPTADGQGFVAAIPKAALSNERGPLGMIAHIDLAWSYGFRDLDTGRAINRSARFMQVVRAAMRQDRFGVAFRWLSRFQARVDGELTGLYQEAKSNALTDEELDHRRLGHLWMLRNDLAGYVLLGDPACHLPLSRESEPQQPQPASITSVVGVRPTAPAVTASLPPATPGESSAPELPLPIAELEAAIVEVLHEERGVKAIARDYGIDRAVLSELAERYRQAGLKALREG